MQTKLERGKAAFHVRSTILAGAPLIVALALCAPDPALAACGASSGAAHAPSTRTGAHTATSIAAPSAAGGGGGGSLGCANGSSVSVLRGLPTTASGRVVEATGAHATRSEMHARTAATRTTNVSAHLRAVRPAHHA